MIRAAIYARYSSDNQRDASIDDQVRLCRELMAREGLEYHGDYLDRAVSGSSLLRLEIQRLLQDASRGCFTVVIAEALDRISRNQADVATLFERLKFSGVRLVTLAEGEVNELHVGLKGTMNALFLKDLADKTRRGLRGRVEAGASGGGNSYGYDIVTGPVGPDGTAARGARRINEVEAAIVRRIFSEYASGVSPRSIAARLNAAGVAGPRGGAWGQSTIHGNPLRGTGILNNELYIGRLVWNRLRYIKDPQTGRRVSRLNPPEARVVRDVAELRIVSQDLWDGARERYRAVMHDTRPDVRAGAIRERFWSRQRPRTLFSGLMRCGACGGAFTKISANLFGCATARNKGTCDNKLNIRRDMLETTVLDALRHHLMDPTLFRVFAEEFTKEFNRLSAAEARQGDGVAGELVKTEGRIAKLVRAISDGVSVSAVREELERLEAQRLVLQARLGQPRERRPFLHPNMAEVYRAQLDRLHAVLEDEQAGPEAKDLIRSLVEAIVLTPEAGKLAIDVRGELGGIIALASNAKKPAGLMPDGLIEQMKMVAGTGFEPVTFRL